jgi:hypothetical protein
VKPVNVSEPGQQSYFPNLAYNANLKQVNDRENHLNSVKTVDSAGFQTEPIA